MKRLNGKEANEAFDNTFEVPLNLDHQPTQEEIFTLELLAVSRKAEDNWGNEIYKWGNKDCPHWSGGFKRECTECWQELQKEL